MVSVGHESLRGQVASAVLPWRSQCEGPVEELVGQSRLSLVVDLQARRERVRVENRVVLTPVDEGFFQIPRTILTQFLLSSMARLACPPTRRLGTTAL